MRGLLLLALSITAPCVASAQADDPRVAEARVHFQSAERHYASADYALALSEFRASYDAMHAAGHPNAGGILFNVARCYAQLGREREAIATFEQFLVEAPANFPARPDAETELRELRARQALSGDGGISPVGPIVIGVGGAASIAGAIVGGLALSLHGDAMLGCVDGRCPPANEAIQADAQLFGNVADGLLFGGLAVAAVGVILLFVLPSEDSAPVAASIAPDHAVFFARGTF